MGATKTYGLTPEQAFEELRRNENADWPEAEAAELVSILRSRGCEVWKPLVDWEVKRLRTGVKALPPMTQLGALPLLRLLEPNIWIATGLGSRGVLYHAWIGKTLAAAILDGYPRLPTL